MAVSGVLGDGAGHAASLVLLKLDHGAAPAHLGAGVDGSLTHDLGVGVIVAGGLGLLRAVTGGVGAVAALAILVADATLELHDQLARGLDGVSDPVDGLAGALSPHLDEVVVAEAVGVANDVLDGVLLLKLELGELLEGSKLELGVHSANVLAHRLAALLGVTLNDEGLAAVLCAGKRAGHTAGGKAANEHLCLEGLGDVGLGDLGRLAQPSGVTLGGQGVLGLGGGSAGQVGGCGDACTCKGGTCDKVTAGQGLVHGQCPSVAFNLYGNTLVRDARLQASPRLTASLTPIMARLAPMSHCPAGVIFYLYIYQVK